MTRYHRSLSFVDALQLFLCQCYNIPPEQQSWKWAHVEKGKKRKNSRREKRKSFLALEFRVCCKPMSKHFPNNYHLISSLKHATGGFSFSSTIVVFSAKWTKKNALLNCFILFHIHSHGIREGGTWLTWNALRIESGNACSCNFQISQQSNYGKLLRWRMAVTAREMRELNCCRRWLSQTKTTRERDSDSDENKWKKNNVQNKKKSLFPPFTSTLCGYKR